MIAFWNSYTQTNPNGDAPLRGVGGRILFYSEKDVVESVKVNGEVSIFLFDANDPVPERSVPVRHVVFKKENLTAFYRKDKQGFHGYEFFVPVDELGNEEMDLAVWAIFHEFTKSGKTTAQIYSTPAVVTLPGPKHSESLENEPEDDRFSGSINLAGGRDEPSEIVQASHQRPAQAETYDSRARRGETIQIPARFAQAWQNDTRNTTQEKEQVVSPNVSPYVPQFQEATNAESQPQENRRQDELSPGNWLKPPDRLVDASQRAQAAASNKFRINPPTQTTSNQPVFEDVSPSGRKTQMWVQ